MTKIYKKYSNRKIYDTELSKYVNFKEIITQVKKGNDIQIFDHDTKKVVTNLVLLELFKYAKINTQTIHYLINMFC